MADEEKIKYSDIIQPDDSIEKLISQLSELNKQYETMVNAIRAGADRIVHSVKQASGATNEGRKSIDEAAAATSRLERAQKELKFAMSETGQQVAWLKAQTIDQNKATVEQQRYIKQAVDSYDRLKADLKETVELYKSLSAAERADSKVGQQLLNTIIGIKDKISELDKEMKPHIETLTEVQKAEQRLAFLQSEEGKRLIELKAKIAELTSARKQEKAAIDPVAAAEEKLAKAQSQQNVELKSLNQQTHEANRIAKLTAQLNNAAVGSYNALAAQYELNKIKLNAMSAEQREATETGKKLESETYAIYQQMIKLQEATGNHRLSVGHYEKAWDGLGFSIMQVVRELPAATVSLNTFFLAISNNIPMVVDEINFLRRKNELLKQSGEETVSISKQISKALFSWNTALVVILTLFSAFGKDVINCAGNLFKAKNAIISTKKALDDIAKELENTNDNFGSNIVSLRKLQNQWNKLKTDAEKTQWIKDNESEFNKLGIAVSSITDAENIFVDNTQAVIDALKLRAKASAAQKLAAEQYEKALIKANEAETERGKGPSASDEFLNILAQSALRSGPTPGIPASAENIAIANQITAEDYRERRIKNLEDEAKVAEETGDAYFKLAAGYEASAQAGLDAASIKPPHKKIKQPKGPRLRDTEDTIESLSLQARKAYEESVTKLEREELSKRRKELVASYNVEVAALNDKYRKIERILNNQDQRYKSLTNEQREGAIKALDDITKAIANKQDALKMNLDFLNLDEQQQVLEYALNALRLQQQAVTQGSEEELSVRLQILEVEKQIAIIKNKQLPPSQQQDEALITASFAKQKKSTTSSFDMSQFDQQQALEEARFNVVERSERELTKFKLEQEKERWEKQIALAEAGALDWSQAEIDTAKAAVSKIDREISKIDDVIGQIGEQGLGRTLLDRLGFSDDQIDALTEAANIVIEQFQAILDAEVEMAERAVEAANERVDAAQKALDAEIEARNNGYANNVATAKKELDQEKKRQQEKQKMLAEAQRRQEALNTITQASSLITASANLWQAFSSIPFVGPALAIAAIATMWGSFAAAKIKARQVTATEEYGEGGLEFLEGGSHASGNDIDLQTKNKKGKNMRAEGGEALAIINRRNTRRYRRVLPDIIDSLNKGIFEDKYMKAFSSGENLSLSVSSNSNVNLTKLEDDVSIIRRQNETKYYSMPDGTMIIQRKNVKRIIKS